MTSVEVLGVGRDEEREAEDMDEEALLDSKEDPDELELEPVMEEIEREDEHCDEFELRRDEDKVMLQSLCCSSVRSRTG